MTPRPRGDDRAIYLVQPRFPPTMWGMDYLLRMTPYHAVFPPLGLLTLAALTPPEFRVTVCDENAGERVDLLAFTRANRERLLLKPNDEYGGKGITVGWEASADEWDAALRAALETPFVVQEKVTIAYEPYPALVDGQVVIGERLVDSDPFLFGSGVDGSLCRLSTVTLLNVTAGGGSTVPVFVIKDEG